MREPLGILSASEVEFLAENELVNIFPTSTIGTLHLICVHF